MNRWMEVVMAWFVGGLVGRILGHTFLVGYLGWPEISGWLSVPIGSAIAWLAVEAKAIIPALRHAYRWTQKPEWPKAISHCFSETIGICRDDVREFQDNWNWRILRAVCTGLMWSSWLLLVIGFYMVFVPWIFIVSNTLRSEVGDAYVFCSITLFLTAIFTTVMTDKFFIHMDWELKTYDRSWRYGVNEEKKLALEMVFFLLFFNPVSPILILLLIAVPYFVAKGLAEIVIWLWRITWKTIQMVNSSQRMAAMTGAAIGLSISQIYGYNPVVCGGVCVLAGLAERLVFRFAERAVRKLTAKQTA